MTHVPVRNQVKSFVSDATTRILLSCTCHAGALISEWFSTFFLNSTCLYRLSTGHLLSSALHLTQWWYESIMRKILRHVVRTKDRVVDWENGQWKILEDFFLNGNCSQPHEKKKMYTHIISWKCKTIIFHPGMRVLHRANQFKFTHIFRSSM